LRDVHGVLGAFFADAEGVLLASDLPQFFANDDLEEAASRAAAFLAACNEADLQGEIEQCVIGYRDYQLYLCPHPEGVLGVLGELAVNRPALRMATRLVARRLVRPPETIPATPSALSQRAGKLPAVADEAGKKTQSDGAGKRMILYRGKRYYI
jgi:predicted regulator of Ras-like GTPase activity (Roadblock/LC7/MglB family)